MAGTCEDPVVAIAQAQRACRHDLQGNSVLRPVHDSCC
jgi:hypothetical protein